MQGYGTCIDIFIEECQKVCILFYHCDSISTVHSKFFMLFSCCGGRVSSWRHIPRHSSSLWSQLRAHQGRLTHSRPNHDETSQQHLPRQTARAPCKNTCWWVQPWEVPAKRTHTLRQVCTSDRALILCTETHDFIHYFLLFQNELAHTETCNLQVGKWRNVLVQEYKDDISKVFGHVHWVSLSLCLSWWLVLNVPRRETSKTQ